MTSTAADFADMEAAYRKFCALFAENFRLVEPSEVFGPIAAFVLVFKVCSAFDDMMSTILSSVDVHYLSLF